MTIELPSSPSERRGKSAHGRGPGLFGTAGPRLENRRPVFTATIRLQPITLLETPFDLVIRTWSALYTNPIGQNPMFAPRSTEPHVDWDGRRFFSRSALRLHLQWSGRNWGTWVHEHPVAFMRLPG